MLQTCGSFTKDLAEDTNTTCVGVTNTNTPNDGVTETNSQGVQVTNTSTTGDGVRDTNTPRDGITDARSCPFLSATSYFCVLPASGGAGPSLPGAS